MNKARNKQTSYLPCQRPSCAFTPGFPVRGCLPLRGAMFSTVAALFFFPFSERTFQHTSNWRVNMAQPLRFWLSCRFGPCSFHLWASKTFCLKGWPCITFQRGLQSAFICTVSNFSKHSKRREISESHYPVPLSQRSKILDSSWAWLHNVSKYSLASSKRSIFAEKSCTIRILSVQGECLPKMTT